MDKHFKGHTEIWLLLSVYDIVSPTFPDLRSPALRPVPPQILSLLTYTKRNIVLKGMFITNCVQRVDCRTDNLQQKLA
jgi:hypothetical protein